MGCSERIQIFRGSDSEGQLEREVKFFVDGESLLGGNWAADAAQTEHHNFAVTESRENES